jgi:hypothetical protein
MRSIKMSDVFMNTNEKAISKALPKKYLSFPHVLGGNPDSAF